jgi:hypothetical protein
MSFTVEGRGIGGTIAMPAGGGTVEVEASAECAWPLGVLEIVRNGTVVGVTEAPRGGSRKLAIAQRVELKSSGWIAARCYGPQGLPSSFAAAHTSPVYVTCGQARAFDGPAVEHMLALVEGGREYLETLAAFYDEATRRRMVRLFDEARAELGNRLIVEGHAHPHHGSGPYHAHGHVDGHSHGGLPRSGGTARGGS